MAPAGRLLAAVTAVFLATAAVPAAALTTDDLDEARQRRRALHERLVAVTTALDDAQTRIDAAHTRRAQLEAEVARLSEAAESATAMVQARAASAFARGSLDGLTLLMDADDPTAAAERARVLSVLARRHQRTIERAVAARDALAQRRAELAAVVRDLGDEEARLVGLRVELADTFARARAQEADLVSRQSRQRLVSRDRQDGVYACPMAAPYHFRDTWGAPRSGGRVHRGVDLFAAMSTPVYAITGGVVSRHSSSTLGGVGLYLTGDDGNVYYYAHLEAIEPGYDPGRRVEAGEQIARNGDTGNARGGAPHVHMEIRPGGGTQINPYPFAAASCY